MAPALPKSIVIEAGRDVYKEKFEFVVTEETEASYEPVEDEDYGGESGEEADSGVDHDEDPKRQKTVQQYMYTLTAVECKYHCSERVGAFFTETDHVVRGDLEIRFDGPGRDWEFSREFEFTGDLPRPSTYPLVRDPTQEDCESAAYPQFMKVTVDGAMLESM